MIELVKATNGEFSVKYQNQWLYSSKNPSKKARDSLPKVGDKVLYLCPSPLLGYGLDTLLESLPVNSFCLAFEHDEVLKDFTLTQIDRYSHPQMLFIDATIESLNIILSKLSQNFNCAVMLTLSAGYLLYREVYDDLFLHVSDFLKNSNRNRYMLAKNSRRWLRNVRFNISQLDVIHEPLFSDDPVVIVAAGPSLDSYINYLQIYRACYRLVVVDTALPALVKYGLTADAIFALEGGYYNLGDFYSCINLDIPLIYDLSTHRATCRMTSGKKAVFFSEFISLPVFNGLKKINITSLPPLGSVAVSAIGYLMAKHVKLIYLCGFDFSYFIHKSHANGCYSHEDSLLTSTRLKPWPASINNLKRPLKILKHSTEGTIYSDDILAGYAQLINNADYSGLKQLKGVNGYGLDLQSGSLDKLKKLSRPLIWESRVVHHHLKEGL